MNTNQPYVTKKLWEVTTWNKKFNGVDSFKQPSRFKVAEVLSRDIATLAVAQGNIKILTTNITNFYTTKELVSNYSNGEVVWIPGGGNAVVQYYCGDYVSTYNIICTSRDTSVLLNKFLYYYLSNMTEELKRLYRGSGIKHPDMTQVLEIEIKIPPIEMQKKIVHMLDQFCELENQLKVELQDRARQYLYYGDELLNESYLLRLVNSLEIPER